VTKLSAQIVPNSPIFMVMSCKNKRPINSGKEIRDGAIENSINGDGHHSN
jgi:hypothetical protein